MIRSLIGAVIIGLVVLVVVLRLTRGSGVRDLGVDKHRKHMDALSSDARREVIERVRDTDRDRREG